MQLGLLQAQFDIFSVYVVTIIILIFCDNIFVTVIVRVFHVVVKKPSLVLFCVVLWVLFSVCASKNRKPLAYSACYNVVCFYRQQRVQKKL